MPRGKKAIPSLPMQLTPGINDPTSTNARLARQVDVLLTRLETEEHITIKEHYMTVLAICRMQTIFMALRKERPPDDYTRAGSSVRKYAPAFQTHDVGGRASTAGPAADELDTVIDDLLGDRDDPVEAAE